MGLLIDCATTFVDNYVWLIHDESTRQTAAIDPGQAEPVLAVLKRRGWRLDWILNTHHHRDHTGANIILKVETGCRIAGAAIDQHRIPGMDHPLHDGDRLCVGGSCAQVLLTPGHTNGHLCFWFAHDQALFCGDTLFSLGCGRLSEGDAQTMLRSLERLARLPGETRIFCAHEYTQANGCFARTVDPDNAALMARLAEVDQHRAVGLPTIPQQLAIELATNPFLRTSDPQIASSLGLHGESPEKVFATLRARKDQFHPNAGGSSFSIR